MCVSRSRVFFGSLEAISAVIKSNPGVFRRAERRIAYSTSIGRICLGGSIIGRGHDKKRSTFSV